MRFKNQDIMQDISSIHAKAYFNLLKTGSWIDERVKKALKPFGITHAQLNALHILEENDPQPVSANDIKNKILVNNPDVTRLLDRLVKKELVCRETCPMNRRMIDISLTNKGRELFKNAQASINDVMGNFFQKQITKEDATELRRILHLIMK